MTEYLVVTQTIMAAGMLFLAVLVYTGRFTRELRDEMRTGIKTQREEMRSDRLALSGEITSLRDEMKSEMSSLHEEMRSDRLALSGEMTSVRDEMKSELSSVRDEMKTELSSVYGEVASLRGDMQLGFDSTRSDFTAVRTEMHEMNGRLGRVEGHLGIGVADG